MTLLEMTGTASLRKLGLAEALTNPMNGGARAAREVRNMVVSAEHTITNVNHLPRVIKVMPEIGQVQPQITHTHGIPALVPREIGIKNGDHMLETIVSACRVVPSVTLVVTTKPPDPEVQRLKITAKTCGEEAREARRGTGAPNVRRSIVEINLLEVVRNMVWETPVEV